MEDAEVMEDGAPVEATGLVVEDLKYGKKKSFYMDTVFTVKYE